MKSNYSVQFIWSDEDGCYLAQVPELPGCVSDGQTYQQALENLQVILEEWIETARAEGMPIPTPLTLQRLQSENLKAQEEFQKTVQDAVAHAIEKQRHELRIAQSTAWRFDPNTELAFSAKTR
jgi:predicted RNase H-like HicB family nuclease